MIKQLLTILFLLYCVPVHGATQQVLVNGLNNDLNVTVTEYNHFYGIGNVSNWSATEGDRQIVWPYTGTIDDLRVKLTADPTNVGSSYAFMVRLDTGCDGTGADTTLTCTVLAGSTTCNNSDGFSINAGECLSIESDPSATAPAGADASWSATGNPTTADETALVGGTSGDLLATTGTEYIGISGNANADGTEFDRTFIASTGGVFPTFYTDLPTAPGGTATRTFTFRDSASAESIVITYASGESGVKSNTGTVTATAGETFVLVSTDNGNTPSASTLKASVLFDPTTEGEWIIPMSSDDTLHVTNTEYARIIAGDDGWSATEANKQQLIQTGSFASDMIIKNMYVELETDPGATGDIFTFRLRDSTGGSGDASAQLESICDGVQTCNASATVTITDDALMSTRVIPTSSPTVGSALISYTGFITPSAEAYTHLMIID